MQKWPGVCSGSQLCWTLRGDTDPARSYSGSEQSGWAGAERHRERAACGSRGGADGMAQPWREERRYERQGRRLAPFPTRLSLQGASLPEVTRRRGSFLVSGGGEDKSN